MCVLVNGFVSKLFEFEPYSAEYRISSVSIWPNIEITTLKLIPVIPEACCRTTAKITLQTNRWQQGTRDRQAPRWTVERQVVLWMRETWSLLERSLCPTLHHQPFCWQSPPDVQSKSTLSLLAICSQILVLGSGFKIHYPVLNSDDKYMLFCCNRFILILKAAQSHQIGWSYKISPLLACICIRLSISLSIRLFPIATVCCAEHTLCRQFSNSVPYLKIGKICISSHFASTHFITTTKF